MKQSLSLLTVFLLGLLCSFTTWDAAPSPIMLQPVLGGGEDGEDPLPVANCEDVYSNGTEVACLNQVCPTGTCRTPWHRYTAPEDHVCAAGTLTCKVGGVDTPKKCLTAYSYVNCSCSATAKPDANTCVLCSGTCDSGTIY